MKRYDGKNAWWFLLIIILYNLIPIITLFLFKDFSNGFILTISYIFYYSFDFLLIPICVRNYIELYDLSFPILLWIQQKRSTLSTNKENGKDT